MSMIAPHTSNRFLPKHSRQMDGWPVPKALLRGLPKSVHQSLGTLYTGKSFLASSLNSYPCVPPAHPPPHPDLNTKGSVERERESQMWREASMSDYYLC